MGAAGLGAVQSADGKTAWVFTAPGAGGRGVAALDAASTAIPAVIFRGAGDGRLFAVSATDGRQLWEFNTVQDFDTANKVPARGGAIAPRQARSSWTGWSTSPPGTQSTAARRRATSCWPSAWTDVPVGITARAALLLTMSAAVTSAAAAACTASTGGPVVLSIPDVRAQSVRVGAWIDTYDTAVVSIAAIMERDLGLPAIQASLYFYADRNAFQHALVLDGYEPTFARDAAATLSGIAGFRRVVLNDANLHWLEWPNRVALLAHELTHTVQYEFSRGRRSTSEQWLREGFAEWVEVYVMDVLDFTTWDQARAIALQRVRDAARKQPLPTFTEMVTYPDWVRTIQRSGEAAVYAQALLAAELLISRHGREAVVGYFRLFETSEDRLANFRAAFGQDLSAFEVVFRDHIAGIRR